MQFPSLKNLTAKNYATPGNKQNEFLLTLGKPHIDSFNYMIRQGLNDVLNNIKETQFSVSNKNISVKISTLRVLPPLVIPKPAKNSKIFPSECRQRGTDYDGCLVGNVEWSINGVKQPPIMYDFGRIPIMLKSDLCHLKALSPKELIDKNEHADEWGGYFIIKGAEKLIRLLVMTRRNFPVAVKRNTWKQQGKHFSDLGVIIRCVKSDQTSSNNILHFVKNGTAKLMIGYKKTLYYIPIILILKCLVNISDEYLVKCLTAGYEKDYYLRGCILKMISELQSNNIISHLEARSYLGDLFRAKAYHMPSESSNFEICDSIIEECVCIHLDNFYDKFNCLVYMVQKLYSVVQNKSLTEGVDSVMTQEVLLGGHLYQQVLKDRLLSWLNILKFTIIKDSETKNKPVDEVFIKKCMMKSGKIGSAIASFLSTGNISSTVSIGAQQTTGLVIIVENINRMRYMSHFKAIHRGSFFQEMRTTEVRQLQPDAWGFICPVHTPDGAPCGLLNHFTKSVQITNVADSKLISNLPEVLISLGMQPWGIVGGSPILCCYPVMLDGRMVGHILRHSVDRFVNKLRMLKIIGERVPNDMEIVLLPLKKTIGQFPGLFLFTGPARMVRPVYNLAAQNIELIGTMEQVYLDISVTPEEIHDGITTHFELSKDNFLSNLACLIPMPDCNQSPRNMYQCQMGKQSMGTPCHTFNLQTETKLYRLQTPNSPLFRPAHYDAVGLDDFPMGVNAIVAVISYTGYDMEDAMIINKASAERGFAHGSILKSDYYELTTKDSFFGRDPGKEGLESVLDIDGLPFPGTIIKGNMPVCCYFNGAENIYIVEYYKGKTDIFVDNVKFCDVLPCDRGYIYGKACITYRVPRNPSVGDKFASRAGQKGICSYLWPAEDMPFTESGVVPDILFNPHGFPSRMTIAMMIECMAGKSAAVHGLVHDASPFKFNEKNTAIDYFGKMLTAGGYNYYGTERMYSGIYGEEMNADIFFGVVHYQRLRHMVSDKWQVRSTGPIDKITRQPVKGRKRGGGIRFGEMERDSLVAHGASFLLQDRLFNCSDKSMAYICQNCGSTLSPLSVLMNKQNSRKNKCYMKCTICEDGGNIADITVPHIFNYLSAQLASVNIKLKIEVA